METEALRSLLGQPREAAERGALRGLLERLLADPGGLAHPLYVGPCADARPLQETVRAVAMATELKLLAVNELSARAAEQRGGALLSERDAQRVAQYGVRSRAGVQAVIWGKRAAESLHGPVAEWVAEGLAVDPGLDLAAGETPAIESALRRLAGPAEGAARVVVRVGHPARVAWLATDTRVRLELAGLQSVAELPWTAEPGEGEGAAAVVVRYSGAAGPAGAERAWARASAAAEAGAAAVIVTDAVGEAALRLLGMEGPEGGSAEWVWETGATVMDETVEWPPLREVLIGSPGSAEPPEIIASFSLRETPLAEVLLTVEEWNRPGTLVVFERGRLGWLRVAGGEVRAARRVQDDTPAGTAAELVSRMRDMARWTGARVILAAPARGDGGLVEQSGGSSCRVALRTVALELGSRRGSSGYGSREKDAGRVALALITLGLRDAAAGVLREGARTTDPTPTSSLMLGHFQAEEEPETAAESFRVAVRAAASESDPAARRALVLDGGLNALLVEVRGGLRSPGSAWSLLRDAELSTSASLEGSAERVGVVLELAVRAGR
ncbi:MAG TPA: hypothetical protein VFI96_01775, partial [Longimicrobiaceae bacterium]|nr:hypothetical protein [Longimicrobiaceae bacterium]